MYITNPIKSHRYSRPLDIHLTTNHFEIKELLDVLYNKYFNTRKKEITKKHLQVLLLNIYVAWSTDPRLEIGVDMSPNSYNSVKRYNQLNITSTLTDVVTELENNNLIGLHKVSEANQRVSYIRTAPTLENYFKKIKLSIFDIKQNNEILVLKDNNKNEIDYLDDSKTSDMRKILGKYNEILRQTFIDIPFLEKPYLQYKGRKYTVNHHSKLVRRIFSKGSFDNGCRYHGGWWQSIGEKQREKILMDDRETIEIDYKSLHPVLAYAKKGIDFWKGTNTTKYSYFNDAYDVPTFGIKDKEDSREVIKLLFLTALNAKNEKECFKSFRDQWDYEKYSYQGLFSDIFLQELLDSIRDRHYQIDDMFCSGFGVDLQKWDSDIVEYIVSDFTERNIPILYINESFIIWKEQIDLLVNNMHTAIKWVTGIVEHPELKYDQFITLAWKDHKLNYVDKIGSGKDYYSDNIPKLPLSTDKCKGYTERWNKHKSYFFEKYNDLK